MRTWHGIIARGLLTAAMATAAPARAAGIPEGPDLVRSSRSNPFAGKSLEAKIQELADREELRELIAIYAHRAALGINIADLFTDDGSLVVRGRGAPAIESRGREAIDSTYKSISSNPGAQLPMIHNIVLEIAGDEARGLCSVEVRGDMNGQNVIASAYYADQYRRVNGRWKFVKRDVNFFHYTTLEKGWATKPLPERHAP